MWFSVPPSSVPVWAESRVLLSKDFILLSEKVIPISFPSKSSDDISVALVGASDISLTSPYTWKSPSQQSLGSLQASVTWVLCHSSA